MKNVLVTGGAGFIGSNFVHYIADKLPDVSIIILDLLTYVANLEALDAINHKFYRGNIKNKYLVRQILEENNIDTVVNFAAETHIDRSILYPEDFIETNIFGTFNLLFQSLKCGVERFHHISTDEVFGTLGKDEPPWTEESPYRPNTPYAATKAGSDHLVRAFGHTYGLPYTISNSSNNFGPYQFPEKLVPIVIDRFLHSRNVPIHGDGSQTRDWLYVKDSCAAILKILMDGKIGESYNVGGILNEITVLEFVTMMSKIFDGMFPNNAPHERFIEFVPDRPGNDHRYNLNSDKVMDLGWYPETKLEDALYETVKWYVDHQDWLDRARNTKAYKIWQKKDYFSRIKKLMLYSPIKD